MGKKNIGGAVLDDLKALPKKILKGHCKASTRGLFGKYQGV